jgi:hypothetical protein
VSPTPTGISLRMHQVGFGDCFLLSFIYDHALDDGRDERHVLIDFGSTRFPDEDDHAGADQHVAVAQAVAERTGGKLDAVVMTHRHKDHLSGFGHPQAGAIIAGLKPRLVVRPWTENPDAARNAKRPKDLRDPSRELVAGLEAAQSVAAGIEHAFRGAQENGDTIGRTIGHLAADQVPNQAAVDLLDAMARNGDLGGRYVYAGESSGLEDVLPGVEVSVLGPPTVDQWPKVATQRANDPEYWLGRKSALGHMLQEAGAPEKIVNGAGPVERDPIDPGPARWLVDKMRDQHLHSLLRLTRALDDAMNNTSVVLLFKAGDRRMLFPGDAQIENWSYALTAQTPEATALRVRLPEVDLYKVGHHGSRNATPRSLVGLWQGRKVQLTSVMSTMPGVHGKKKETAVPRETLTDALAALGQLRRTDELADGAVFQDLVASTRGQKPFRVAGA